jgi:hypothetical protein
VVGSTLKLARSVPDNRTMSLIRRLWARLTYANVMSSVALFVALGGGAYALSVPKNSVGPRQLKRNAVTTTKIRRNAVTSTKVRDHSLKASDLASGVIPKPTAIPAAPTPPVLGGARAADTDPLATPGTLIKSTSLSLTSAGKAFVLATVNSAFLTCGGGSPCEATWGVYVDSQAVPATGLHLQAAASGSDGNDFVYPLYGLTATLQPGSHTVTLNMTSSGSPAFVGQLGAQLGAIASGA